MRVVNNRAIVLRTKRPHLVTEKIKNYKILEEAEGVYKLAVRWKLYEAQMLNQLKNCLLYTSPSPRDRTRSRMPSSA